MILEFNTTDITASYKIAATGDPIVTLAGGEITLALAPMISIDSQIFIDAVAEVSLWAGFARKLELIAQTPKSPFSRELIKTATHIEMKSQVSMDTIIDIEWTQSTDMVERQAGVELTMSWTDWFDHLLFLQVFTTEILAAKKAAEEE